MQSVGDSKHPLIYLIISSVINIVLDIVFIVVFHFGVGSAAFATSISQFTSALLCLIRLIRTNEPYQVVLKDIKIEPRFLRQIVSIGLPSGFQNSIISFANVIVQTNINSFGKMAMAGCGAYSKIEGFGFLPITCFAMSLTTFISQNLGARQYDRAKKGANLGIFCSTIIAELVGFAIYRFALF